MQQHHMNLLYQLKTKIIDSHRIKKTTLQIFRGKRYSSRRPIIHHLTLSQFTSQHNRTPQTFPTFASLRRYKELRFQIKYENLFKYSPDQSVVTASAPISPTRYYCFYQQDVSIGCSYSKDRRKGVSHQDYNNKRRK